MAKADIGVEILLLEAEEVLKQHQKEGGLSIQDFNTAMVLLTAVRLGPGTESIALELGVDEEFVRAISVRMRQSGLWSEHHVSTEGWFYDQAFPGLYEDLEVALGRSICIKTDKEVLYVPVREGSLRRM